MKLTPENRKALEDALQNPMEYDFAPGEENIFVKNEIIKAAALLLEIWEPLAEMVEARGKFGEAAWTRHPNECVVTDDFGLVASFEYEEERDFAVTSANTLTTIKKTIKNK